MQSNTYYAMQSHAKVCKRIPLECINKCGIKEIPREEVRHVFSLLFSNIHQSISLNFFVRLHYFGVFILLLINIISLQLPVDKAMYSKSYLELRKLVTSEEQLQSLIT